MLFSVEFARPVGVSGVVQALPESDVRGHTSERYFCDFCARVFALAPVTQEKSLLSPKEPQAQPSSRMFCFRGGGGKAKRLPRSIKTTHFSVCGSSEPGLSHLQGNQVDLGAQRIFLEPPRW